jgi:bifunctional UDP-N-acetylglucosamine pyrophosphorylase/glucosamine-1-phosphate N-acetyltransferase
MQTNCVAIILAAGQGTRMKSDIPKVLHQIGGRFLVDYVIDAIEDVGPDRICVGVGFKADQVMKACRGRNVEFVIQREQLGTGHAVMQCERSLEGFEGTVIVMNGDVPGLEPHTIRKFIAFHESRSAAATVLTAVLGDPTGYGRIVKDDAGNLVRIVEEKDAGADEKSIREVNSGLFCFDKKSLFATLKDVGSENAQGEYYLTDVIGIMQRRREPVAAFCVEDSMEVAGVNTPAELKSVSDYLERKHG